MNKGVIFRWNVWKLRQPCLFFSNLVILWTPPENTHTDIRPIMLITYTCEGMQLQLHSGSQWEARLLKSDSQNNNSYLSDILARHSRKSTVVFIQGVGWITAYNDISWNWAIFFNEWMFYLCFSALPAVKTSDRHLLVVSSFIWSGWGRMCFLNEDLFIV